MPEITPEEEGTGHAAPIIRRPEDEQRSMAAPTVAVDDAAAKELARVSDELSTVVDSLKASIPAQYRDLMPEGLPALEKVKWLMKAQAVFATTTNSPVPTTDNTRPTTTPRAVDLSSLSPVARLAAGYVRR